MSKIDLRIKIIWFSQQMQKTSKIQHAFIIKLQKNFGLEGTNLKQYKLCMNYVWETTVSVILNGEKLEAITLQSGIR